MDKCADGAATDVRVPFVAPFFVHQVVDENVIERLAAACRDSFHLRVEIRT
jgi:hypothetical protein